MSLLVPSALLVALVITASACTGRCLLTSRSRPPSNGERVLYGEFDNDGSLRRARLFLFVDDAWKEAGTCHTSTGTGCAPGCNAVSYPPATSVAGMQITELNSDRNGFLAGMNPKSRFVDSPELWNAVFSSIKLTG